MALEDLVIELTKAINRNTNTLLTIHNSMHPAENNGPAVHVEKLEAEPVKKPRAKPAAKPAATAQTVAPIQTLEMEEEPEIDESPTLTKDEMAAKITKAVSLNKDAVIKYMKPKNYTKVDAIPLDKYAEVAAALDKIISDAAKEDDGEDFSFGED